MVEYLSGWLMPSLFPKRMAKLEFVLISETLIKLVMLSFMDGFSGYNKILMALEDMEKTTFITEWGTYCYRVMPFGLKNAGATY